MKYKIVFRGKFNSDFDQHEILENLSELFDEPEDDIYQQFFLSKDKTQILISGLNNEDAIEYQEALAEAGVESDIDIDLDIEEITNITPEIIDPTVAIDGDQPSLAPSASHKTTSVESQFLTPQEFTLMKDVDDAAGGETNRVEKLKRITQKRTEYLEVDDRDVEAEPPLFHSGVRIGRLRFVCRITFALAILMLSLNVLPLQFQSYLGSAGFIPSFFLVFFAFMFVIMVICQRFCDIDNLSVGTVAFVVIILGTLLISFFIGNYDTLNESKIKFAQDFLRSNSMNPNFFSIQKVLEGYLVDAQAKNIIQQIDAIIKWIAYILVLGGGLILFTVPSIEGNNQYGAQTADPDVKSYIIFVISFLCMIYSAAYPFSTKENRGAYRLYQNDLYEYLGILKPLPNGFEAIYREQLQKTQQKLSN